MSGECERGRAGYGFLVARLLYSIVKRELRVLVCTALKSFCENSQYSFVGCQMSPARSHCTKSFRENSLHYIVQREFTVLIRPARSHRIYTSNRSSSRTCNRSSSRSSNRSSSRSSSRSSNRSSCISSNLNSSKSSNRRSSRSSGRSPCKIY